MVYCWETNYHTFVEARHGDAQHLAHFSAYLGKIVQYSPGILDKHLS